MIPTMGREQKILALWQAFVTAYMTATAGAALAAVVGLRVAGLMALLGAALNSGTVTYIASMRPVPPPDSPRQPPGMTG